LRRQMIQIINKIHDREQNSKTQKFGKKKLRLPQEETRLEKRERLQKPGVSMENGTIIFGNTHRGGYRLQKGVYSLFKDKHPGRHQKKDSWSTKAIKGEHGGIGLVRASRV